jgi:SAM-dependent methyltransferase
VDEQPVFRPDLYRGTAIFYDRYRVAYPSRMLDDLATRARVGGTGRLLDLACGTGQVTFGLASRFSEVWAIDLEDETVAFARAKAQRLGVTNVRWLAGRAEDLEVDEPFELITIGNAFHRLDRRRLVANAKAWLQPGGHVALLWSSTAWTGDGDWQRTMGAVVRHWMHTADTTDRVPANLDAALAAEPNLALFGAGGFSVIGTFDFPTRHVWSVEALIGLMYSTSVLSRSALGTHAEAFEHDLRRRLLEVNPRGVFEEEIDFAYELVARPALM